MLLNDNVDDLIGNDDLLDHGLAVDQRDELFVSTDGRQGGVLIGVDGQGHLTSDLTVDLDGQLNGGVYGLGLVVLGPLSHGGKALAAHTLPHLLAEVRCEGTEHPDEHGELILGDGANLKDLVEQTHHGGDRRVELHLLDVGGDLLEGLVEGGLQLGIPFTASDQRGQIGDSLKEALTAAHGVIRPGRSRTVITHKEDVDAEDVGAHIVHDVVGVNDVTAGLGHLLSVRSEDQTLSGTLGIRLSGGHEAEIVEEMMPEAGVDQMAGNVLHTAVIPVNGHPVAELVHIGQRLGVVGVDVAEEVPGGTGPLGHGIGLTLGVAAALRALAVDEVVQLGQRGLTALTGLKLGYGGQTQGELLVRNGDHAARGAMDDRDGLTPVSLTVEGPVLHFELDAALADALLLQPLDHSGNGIGLVIVGVEEIGVDHGAVAGVGSLLDVATLDDLDDIDAELLGEVVVALIVGGDGHNGARAVAHHDVVGDVDGDLLTVDGVDARKTLEAHAGLILDQLGALELGLLGALHLISLHLGHVLDAILHLLNDGMLGSDDHEGHTEEGVGAGGVDAEGLVGIRQTEVDEGTAGLTDPVDLLHLDIGEVVDVLQTLQELVGILGNAEIPDVLRLLDDVGVADVALTALGILVGEHYLTVRAVVDHSGIAEGQAVFKHLEEDELRPLVVVLLGGVDDAIPVEGEANTAELRGKFLDVAVRQLTGVNARLDGRVLGGQTEGVKANGKEDVVALHSSLAANDLKSGVGLDVTHVHTHARGVGELHEPVELRLVGMILCGEDAGLVPLRLPFLFNGRKIVLHSCILSFFMNKIKAAPVRQRRNDPRYHSA